MIFKMKGLRKLLSLHIPKNLAIYITQFVILLYMFAECNLLQ